MTKQAKPIPASKPAPRQAGKKLNAEIDKIIERTEEQNVALGKVLISTRKKDK
jgi:hypothetical protein